MSNGDRLALLPPTADWGPDHDKKWFRSALAYAKQNGWHFRRGGKASHIFGTAYCRAERSESCRYRVFSTGDGGEGAAAELRRLVDNCPHLNEEKLDRLERAEQTLNEVGLLIDCAVNLLDAESAHQLSDDHLARALDLHEIAAGRLADVDKNLTAASAADEEAAEMAASERYDNEALRSETAATVLLGQLDLPPIDPLDLLDRAEPRAVEAEVALQNLPDRERRVATARRLLFDLRARLLTLKTRCSLG